MKRLLIILTITTLFISCNQGNSVDQDKMSTSVDNGVQASALPPVAYTGALVIGHESQYLKDCGTKEEWWIEFEAVDEELNNQYEDIAGDVAYKEIYAEVKGYLEAAPEDGFAADYDKVLNITEIVKLDDLDDGNDCTKAENTTDVN